MPDASQIAAFVVASAILGITPGPDIIYVTVRGAAQGPRAGLAAAAGLCTGIIGHTALCVAGISALLAASATAFTIVKFAGAAYLIWLGIGMLRGGGRIDLSNDIAAQPVAAIYRQTILMNLLNPKVALFFLAFLPQFADPAAGPLAPQLALLGFLFMVVSFIVMGTAGLAGGQVRRLLVGRPRGLRGVHYAGGGVLIALGLRLIYEETP
jgi:threonine/homoserine/homoserine lactone efflux protein